MNDVTVIRFVRPDPTDRRRPRLSDVDAARRTPPDQGLCVFFTGPHAKLYLPQTQAALGRPGTNAYAIPMKADEPEQQMAAYLDAQGFDLLPDDVQVQLHVPDDAPEWLAPLTGVILHRHRITLWWKGREQPLGLSPEQRARRPAALDRGGSRIRGASEAIQHLHRQIERAGRLNQPVLILAEPGFDTRLIVRWLAKSGGRTGRRISQRLRGLPDDQATSLMFGHQFDGGPLRRGRIREAEGGTIHVPDLFELSPTLQARFVRALKEAAAGRVRVESVNTYDQGEMVDVRFIADAATDPRGSSPRDLPTIVHELYLHVAHVVLRWPPLRERVEDIAHIATSCLEDTAVGRRLSPRALERLEQHPWWGNERELEMVLTRCLVRTPEGETIPVRMVDEVLRELGPTLTTTGLPIPCDLESDLAKIELATLEAARRQSGGNASKAGELVGLKSPKNFGRKLEAARKTANVGVQA